MATQSVSKNFNGPTWPLGLITNVTPGTPIGIMSLVDPTSLNDPSKPTPGTVGADEYSHRANQILFQGFKAGSSGLVANTGNVYILLKGVQGAGNHDDYGSMVGVVPSGGSFLLAASSLNRDVFGPYQFSIDADNAGDAALVTLIIQ